MTFSVDGPGPFPLPPTQQTETKRTSPQAITLYLHVDTGAAALKTVTTLMTVTEARDLAIRLWLAADGGPPVLVGVREKR